MCTCHLIYFLCLGLKVHQHVGHGQHLRVKEIDDHRITQDSCIVVSFQQLSHASARDTNLVDNELGYVGDLEGIYEVNYHIMKQV